MIIQILSLILASSFTFSASANQNICPGDQFVAGGDFTPWPWGTEMDLPWEDVSGVWSPINGNCDVLFTISIVRSFAGWDTVVHQYDPFACKTLSKGRGETSSKIVKMTMLQVTGFSYDLTLRSFPYTPISGVRSGRSLVVTLFPVGDWERRKSYQLQKIAETPKMICYKNRSNQQ